MGPVPTNIETYPTHPGRELNPKLKSYIDDRVFASGIPDSIAKRDGTEILIDAARALIGVKESGGDNKGPVVSWMQGTCGIAEGQPWCMALAQSCVAYAETYSGRISQLYAGEFVRSVWNNTPGILKRKVPERGVLTIWQMGNTIRGHCNICVGVSGDFQMGVEGNTSDGKGMNRDGDGCFLRKRSIFSTDGFKILGYLKPF